MLSFLKHTLFSFPLILISSLAFPLGLQAAFCSDSPCFQFLLAAAEGNVTAVEEAIASGIDVDSMDPFNNATALILASHNGFADVVKLLLARKARIDFQGTLNGTALSSALENDHTEVIEVLLAAGAALNVLGFKGCPALIVTTAHRNVLAVDLLLQRGADVTAQCFDHDFTALHIAAYNHDCEIAKRLLAAGANVNAIAEDVGTPLMNTILSEDEDDMAIIQLLLDAGANPHVKNIDGETSFWLALRSGKWEVAKHLLSIGADFDSTNNFQETPLIIAAAEGLVEAVQVLLSLGVDVNARDNKGNFALGRAAIHGHLDVAKLLLGSIDAMRIEDVYRATIFATIKEDSKMVNLFKEALHAKTSKET